MEDFEHHKHQRRILQAAFKNDAMRHYTDEINRIYDRGLDEWESHVDNTMPFFMHIKDLLLTVAAEIFAGETDYRSDRVRQLNQAFLDTVNGLMYILPLNIPGTTLHKGLKGKKFLQKYFGDMIADKRAGDGKDMLTFFSKAQDEEGNFFTAEDVANQAIFLMFAAHDTTTSAITHTIYFLARNPEVKEKLYAEVDSLSLDGLKWEDQDSVPYMQMVFNEVQRVRPSVPLVPRRAIRDVEMAGVHIPAHTMVFTFPRFSHWMEEYWTNPRVFDPERFSPERAEHKQHAFLFHPFGGGAHKCIGMHFSQMEYKNFLYKFIKRFDFEANHKSDDIFMQTFPLPKPSDNMPIRLKRR